MIRFNRDRRTAARLVRSSGQPMLEHLEDRKLLATFVVDSLDTVDDGNRGPGQFALIEAIADANANADADEIVFSDSLIGQTLVVPAPLNINTTLTVRGPSTGVFTISGGGTSRIFEINDGNSGSDLAVVIQNLVLTQGGGSGGSGGAILSAEALELRNVLLTNNSADLGGAVLLTDGSLTTNSTTRFTDNTATNEGGAIMMATGTVLNVNGSTFSGNSGTSGGAIYANNTNTVTMSGATFTGNTASNDGGAFTSFTTTSLSITNSTFTSNTATSDAGAIFAAIANGGTLALTGVTLTSNTAGSAAGAMDITLEATATATLNSLTANSNQAGDSGGALRVVTAGATLTIVNSTFNSNTAVNDGGAIETLAERLVVQDSIFGMNSARQGGAISTNHTGTRVTSIEDSTFTSNTASENGGAVYSRKPFSDTTADPTLRSIGSTFSMNTAQSGGAIYVSGRPNTRVLLDAVQVLNNTASVTGGGIMLTGINDETTFELDLRNSTLTGNRTTSLDGGGLFTTAGTLTITDSTINGNTAFRDGGGIHDAATNATILRSTIDGNTAGPRGGGYYKARTATTTTFTNSLVSNNTTASSDGGGIFFRGTQFVMIGSTVSGNTASAGGGLRLDQTTTARIDNSTITNNTARGQFGGITLTSTALTLRSSIVAGNFDADATEPNLDPSALDTNTNNLIATTVLITALGDFGGPTLTHVPTQGSAAINAGSNPNTLTTDARGFSRDDGGGTDIGATEAFRPTATLEAEAVTIANRTVVVNITSATDTDGEVTAIRVYRDVNNNGIAETNELVSTVMLGGTVSFPVEDLQVGENNLLLVPIDNTGLLGNTSTGTITLVAIPAFTAVELRNSNNVATTTFERHRPLTVNVTGSILNNAAGSVVGFDVYVDLNNNGIAETSEFLAAGFYDEDTANTASLTLPGSVTATLPLGASNLLIVPLTSRSGDERFGSPTTVAITATPARTANPASEVSATADGNEHRVFALSGDGSPLLFEQDASGNWTARRLDNAAGVTGNFTTEVEVWSNAAGLTRAAVVTDSSVIVFTEQADGTWTSTDLGTTVAGSTTFTRAMTRFTTLDGRVYLAGYTATDRLVAFVQNGADSAQWVFDDISADLDGRSLPTPVLDEVVSYVTAWNQWSIVGIDENGDIQNVWVLPGTFEEWTLNNLSDITGAPTLASGLSVILTTWSGINLTALDASGNLLVTWWVPAFGGDWVSSDLSEIADNSGSVDDRVIVEVMTGYYTSWNGMNYAGVNAEGDLIIYWWVPAFGGQWLVSQITDGGAGNSYNPQADIFGYVSPLGTLNVMGSDADGDVLRSSWRPGDEGLWTTEVLSEIAPLV